ncbi:AbiV family abortive infection protein [Panacibacter sp. DH6]|uniref:AbiV family abortive infection protein n=1 Tax=Panacibacter microcysteis TaxID=2793269 RepID=A0A931E4D6_9BACT|nr:AbiV family abortive infection protein [Panacibacter microcysteis]MBG9374768.1 AbiV family abortive infection protein [Panacibacter microcysteis]
MMNFSENDLLIAVLKSISNSEDLISDADLLLDYVRLPRAHALYLLAIEEAGKAMDIYESLLFGTYKDSKGQKKLKENFKDHLKKAGKARSISILWAIQLFKNNNKSKGEEILQHMLLEIGAAKEINDYKNYSLYTSFIHGTYKAPSEIITEKMVSVIRSMAKDRFKLVKQLSMIPPKEYEEMRKYAEQNPITSEANDEEVMNYLKENVSIDFFEKISSMAKNKN